MDISPSNSPTPHAENYQQQNASAIATAEGRRLKGAKKLKRQLIAPQMLIPLQQHTGQIIFLQFLKIEEV